jgi:hypothetical protein
MREVNLAPMKFLKPAFKNPLRFHTHNSLKSGNGISYTAVFDIHPLVERLELLTENRVHRGNRRNAPRAWTT